jgi:UDP-N-acetylmuramyl pentapeptide phosphotransferase/UDP-N-acetylglucosamine-1-phosphate transferase
MTLLIISFVVALLAALILVRSTSKHGRLSVDDDFQSPQKFHARAVPRIGGVAVFVAIACGALTAHYKAIPESSKIWLLIFTSLPAFLFGLAEDLTKNVSPRRRLVATAVSASLGVWLLGGLINRTDIPGLDPVLAFFPAALLLTVFVVTGVANAVNIIDGFNGLASMCVVMIMTALAYVAFQVGDQFIFTVTVITAGGVLGFFFWNFPAGLIFLGDGGAYLLGFLVGELSVLLLVRNLEVSPMFPLLLCAYPIFETIFSIYRKKFLRGISPGVPDGIHLHMLVYKRLMRWAVGHTNERRKTTRNSMTSPYLWLLCLLSVIPAVLWWDSTAVLSCFLFLFMLSYVMLYWSIVRFKTPKWLVWRR